MATYVVTESTKVYWDDIFNYKYRYKSKDGSPVALLISIGYLKMYKL